MANLVPGDWAKLTFFVSVDTAGYWHCELEQSEKYLHGKSTVCLASGSGPHAHGGKSLKSIGAQVALKVEQAITRIVDPM